MRSMVVGSLFGGRNPEGCVAARKAPEACARCRCSRSHQHTAARLPVPDLAANKHRTPHLRAPTGMSHARSVRCGASLGSSIATPLQGDNNPGAEHSVWAANVRGFLFYLWTFTLALPLFVIMLVQAPFVAVFDKQRRLAQHFVNDIWAKLSTRLFYRVHVEGRENLPAPDEPAVYVANHQSFLDIYTLFHLGRPFKFISKTSNFLIPIVGWSMFMTGHVRLNRVDRRSQLACLSTCRGLLQKGASVLFFPEGTRATDMRVQEFKKGAFSVAAKAGVPVVPVSLIGTGRMMPNKQEQRLFPGDVRVVVHPRVLPATADKMLEQTREAILSGLPSQMRPLTP